MWPKLYIRLPLIISRSVNGILMDDFGYTRQSQGTLAGILNLLTRVLWDLSFAKMCRKSKNFGETISVTNFGCAAVFLHKNSEKFHLHKKTRTLPTPDKMFNNIQLYKLKNLNLQHFSKEPIQPTIVFYQFQTFTSIFLQ